MQFTSFGATGAAMASFCNLWCKICNWGGHGEFIQFIQIFYFEKKYVIGSYHCLESVDMNSQVHRLWHMWDHSEVFVHETTLVSCFIKHSMFFALSHLFWWHLKKQCHFFSTTIPFFEHVYLDIGIPVDSLGDFMRISIPTFVFMFNDGLKRKSNFLIENLIQPFEFGDFLGKPV